MNGRKAEKGDKRSEKTRIAIIVETRKEFFETAFRFGRKEMVWTKDGEIQYRVMIVTVKLSEPIRRHVVLSINKLIDVTVI